MASAKEIKISIKTALNAAGIEATKEQLAALTGHVEKANASMKRAATEVGGEWTKLPGVFGKVQNALDGVVGKAFAVIGAFKTGVDIGNWIQDNIIVPLFKIKDPIEELKKKNGELKREAEKAANAWAKGQETVAEQLEAAARAADNAVAHIDKLAAAYVRMQDAKTAVSNAKFDAEELKLQRDKFTSMTKLSNEGKPEQAAAVGKKYDVLIEETRAKKEIAKTDAEIAKNAAEIEAREKSITELKKDEIEAQKRYVEAQKKVDELDNGDALENVLGDQWDKAMKQATRNRDKALAELNRLREKREGKESERETLKETSTARKQERENAVTAAALEIDKRKQEYADYIKEVERQNAEAAKREAEERRKAENEVFKDKIANLHKLADVWKDGNDLARQAQSEAASKLQQAWGWYRDKGSMAAQLEEEKEEANAERQYEKDFTRLQRNHRNWRDATNLSVNEEAVRRVAIAREEKVYADEYERMTAENTQHISEAIDHINSLLHEGAE